jgi:hypothetical protein
MHRPIVIFWANLISISLQTEAACETACTLLPPCVGYAHGGTACHLYGGTDMQSGVYLGAADYNLDWQVGLYPIVTLQYSSTTSHQVSYHIQQLFSKSDNRILPYWQAAGTPPQNGRYYTAYEQSNPLPTTDIGATASGDSGFTCKKKSGLCPPPRLVSSCTQQFHSASCRPIDSIPGLA